MGVDWPEISYDPVLMAESETLPFASIHNEIRYTQCVEGMEGNQGEWEACVHEYLPWVCMG